MLKTPVWKHFAAFIYDIFPLLGILIITSGVALLFRTGNGVEPHTWWFMALIYTEIAGYYIYFWKVGGQTIGMRAWKIKIVPTNPNHTNLSWTQACLRFLAGILSTVLLGLGVFWKLFSKENLTWMDSVSRSKTLNIDD